MPAISTNVSANTTLRYVNINTARQSQFLAQLSSGSRVQKASDDAASLAIGTKIKADATVYAQTAISAANAQSVLNTADGGLAQVSDILQRLKALATQAQSGTNDSNALTNIDKEFKALLTELNSISTSVTFNGTKLLDGSYTGSFLLGTAATDTITASISSAVSSTGLSISSAAVTSTSAAASASTLLDTAINTVSGLRAQVGADSSRVNFRTNVINVSKENADAAASALLDADVAAVQSAYVSAEVLTEAGIAALQKANSIPQQLLQLLKS